MVHRSRADTCDDEPSLGFLERHCGLYCYGRQTASLGSFDRVFNQLVSWDISRSSQHDNELDNCDNESDEPLLTECSRRLTVRLIRFCSPSTACGLRVVVASQAFLNFPRLGSDQSRWGHPREELR